MPEAGIVLKRGATTLADGSPQGSLVARLSVNGTRLLDPKSPILAEFVAMIDLVTHTNVVQVVIGKQAHHGLQQEHAKHCHNI